MSDLDQRSALSRIVAAHRGVGADQSALEPALQTGLTRAIRRAAMPFATLTTEVADVMVTGDVTLSDAVNAMPAHGLTAAIEDEEGRRGLVALDHPLVDALIEVQATGMVEEAALPPRAVTRIDEALCRDFIDLVLGAFAQEASATPNRDWPDRMRYGSIIADRSQLNLLMPQRTYRMLCTTITMGGRKTGDLVLLLPTDPAVARARASAAPADKAPVDWSTQMLSVLGEAPMTLDAVLMRVTLPLGQVEAMADGELVPFDQSDLGKVTLEDETGHVFARGSLGQLSGRRAMRFGGDTVKPQPVPEQGPPGLSDPLATSVPAPNPMGLAQAPAAALPGTGAMVTAPDPSPPAPIAGFDPDAPMRDFDPDAPMGGFDPNAPIGEAERAAPGQ